MIEPRRLEPAEQILDRSFGRVSSRQGGYDRAPGERQLGARENRPMPVVTERRADGDRAAGRAKLVDEARKAPNGA